MVARAKLTACENKVAALPHAAPGRSRLVCRLAVAAALVWGGSLFCSAPVEAQLTAETLVGKSISDEAPLQEVTNAINRFRDRDIDGCRALLERVKSNNAKAPPPGVMMAMLWLGVNQLPQARAELENTVGKFPTDPEPYLLLGDLAFRDGRLIESDLLFTKATELTAKFTENPKRKRDFDIRCQAGNAAVHEARKEWEEAQKHLEAWVELDPEAASAHQRLGVVLFQMGKEDLALAQFKDAKKVDPSMQLPEMSMAMLYDTANKKDAARKLIESAVKASPEDAKVLLSASQWYLGQSDMEAAKANAEKALKIDPKNLEGRIVCGAIARFARDYKTAEKYFSDAHVQSPGNFAASNSLALVLVESDDKELQRRSLEMAEANAAMHRENSNQVNALTTLAWIYYKLGRREDAEKILSQITQNNALTTDGAYYVAKILSDRGENDRARKILEQVLGTEALFATRPDATDLLAKIKKDAR